MDQLHTLEFLHPLQQGSWTFVPCKPGVALVTPPILVSETNLDLDTDNNSTWAIKHLTVQVPFGTTFFKNVEDCEDHMRRAASALWPLWYGEQLNKAFCSVLKKDTQEIKFNIPFVNGAPKNDIDMCDRHSINDGVWVVIRFLISGLWCSHERCGIRCDINNIELLNAPKGIIDLIDDDL